ncbi:hypothetical protein CTA1_11257 [Colletotrichum tanaceti]|uniref:Uncharacterized protein n=1 Tax=Colletotrichum tanaceti TaxID=1306861 RepID=A0A4U6XFI6_9PEZI|nr:hypothetical protein CTA1_11257 [Colletotrichum tanaceti]
MSPSSVTLDPRETRCFSKQGRVGLVDDLHLDAAVAVVRGEGEGVDGPLERERVRDEALEVEDAAAQTGDAGGPRVAVVHDLAADADDHDGAAAADGEGRRADAALDAGALEHGARGAVLVVAKEAADGPAVALAAEGRVDPVGEDAGDEGLREGEARGLDVGDDERVGAGRAGGGEGDEADRPGAADHGADAEGEAGGADPVHADAEGLEEGALGVRDVVGESVEGERGNPSSQHSFRRRIPLGRVALVALDGAVVRVDAGELDVLAEVVAAVGAEEALAAGHAGLDGDAVAGLEVPDALAAADDDAGGLVADDAVALEDERADAARLPEVDVGSGRGGDRDRTTHPQTPVALTWTNASPRLGASTGASSALSWWSAVTIREGFGRGASRRISWSAATGAERCFSSVTATQQPLVFAGVTPFTTGVSGATVTATIFFESCAGCVCVLRGDWAEEEEEEEEEGKDAQGTLGQVEARVVEAQAAVEVRDGLELVGRQVEAVDLEVLPEAVLAVALGDDGDAALRRPAEQDLGGRDAVAGGGVPDDVDLEQAPGVDGALVGDLEEGLRPEGRVGRDGDAVLPGHGDEVGLHEVRVVLDLERRDGVAGVRLHVVERLGLEVGDADGLGDALVDERLHGLPRLADRHLVRLDDGALLVHPPALELVDGRVNVLEGDGEVDEEQVDVAQPPGLVLLLGHGDGVLPAVVVVPQLGRDEDVLALHEPVGDGAADTLAGLLFVLVVVGAVEEAVTGLDGLDWGGLASNLEL